MWSVEGWTCGSLPAETRCPKCPALQGGSNSTPSASLRAGSSHGTTPPSLWLTKTRISQMGKSRLQGYVEHCKVFYQRADHCVSTVGAPSAQCLSSSFEEKKFHRELHSHC